MMLWGWLLLVATPIQLEDVRAAARNNTEALLAELEFARVSQQVVVSRASVLPRVTVEAGVSRSVSGDLRTFATIPDPTAPRGFRQQAIDVPGFTRDHYSLGLSVSQLLYDGGRVWSQLAQSDAQAQAQEGQTQEQRLSSELEAIRRFYELLRAQSTLTVLEALVERSQTQLARARALFDAGRASLRDSIDAEVNLGQDRMAAFRQKQNVTAAQTSLAVWLARQGTDAFVAMTPRDFERGALTLPALDVVMSSATKHRPLLKALASRTRAARQGVEVARSGYWPRLHVTGNYVRQSPTADPFFTNLALQNSVSAGANFSWDIFDGFLTAANVRQAEAAEKTAQLTFEQTRRELEAEVRKTWAAYDTTLEVSKVARENFEWAKKGFAIAEERFAAGAGSTLDVRDAQLKWAQAELSNVESRIDVEIAKAAMERVTGIRFEDMTP